MNNKNTVTYTKESIGLVNDILNNVVGNIKVSCKVMTSNNDVVEETFLLDDGATNILRSYYKSKQKEWYNIVEVVR